MKHIPVLLDESIKGLDIKPAGTYVDATLGCAGHTQAIASKLETGRVIAIDCDGEAIDRAKKQLVGLEDKITFICGNFRDIERVLKGENIEAADGILCDLGVSSPQLDDISRGFSYMQDTSLDMRMDRENPLTAYEIVNGREQRELSGIFSRYGEERYANQISRAIVKKRDEAPIATTFELNEVILSAIPAKARRERQHPSKRCFQALRIAVGDELGALKALLDAAPLLLKPGGRICIISFHSLEDRMVKQAFAAYARGCTCPSELPVCVCGGTPELKLITRRPVTPGALEIEQNPRARSAKLRVAEKL